MIVEQEIVDDGVDRRDETLIVRHPGFDETVQVTRDVAEERRMHLFRVYRLLWSIFALLEILMVLRLIMRFMGANPHSGFAVFLYGLTGLFVGPFNGMLALPTFEGAPLEVTTLVAMAVYFLVFLVIDYCIFLVTDRPRARSFRRVTREQTPGGESVVRTTISKGKL